MHPRMGGMKGPTMKHPQEPISIIGIGCRFPKAGDPDGLWRCLVEGVDAIGEIPASRFPVDRLYDPRPSIPGRIMTRWGGFLEGVEEFDAAFFGISPREAAWLDPQQRLLLETAWEAMEAAGQAPDRLRGSNTSVFVGLWLNEYESRMFRDPAQIDFYMTTGTGRYSASGRLSHFFGWHGPSVTIDCACSSSLVAVHLACQSLRAGESDLAVAGGANVLLEPSITLAYSQSRMMAPDGRCKFGDARANGYVRSDGAGVVVLKMLSRALADGDPIEALILGSAVNNDGGTSGSFGTPGPAGQEDLLRKACAAAGVRPADVDFVEAHGTGTRAGDPVELGALAAVLGKDRPLSRKLIVGSIKTNIGHTEGAAGVAGLIKAALSLKHRTIPRNMHFETPNPDIPWERLPIAIPREAVPWPSTGHPGIAGVSSFGIAGTNAHVILREHAPPQVADVDLPAGTARGQEIVLLSARSPDALHAMAGRWEDQVRRGGDGFPLRGAAATAALRRVHHEHRLAVVADGPRALLERLAAYRKGEPSRGMAMGDRGADGAPKVVFVCPGQGSQWAGMGRILRDKEPVFRAAVDRCDAAIRDEAAWSVTETLYGSSSSAWLDDIAVIQPAIFAMQVALAELWRSWGIVPSAVVGHSMGEAAAACISGALDLESAVRVICRRSLLMKRVAGRGAMALVDLPLAEARATVRDYEGRVSVAVSNSARSTVLSGDPGAIDEVLARLESREVFCRRIKVDVASHSPQMDPIRGELVSALSGLVPQGSDIPIISTVTGEFIPGGALDASYWGRNVREPVLFASAIDRLVEHGCRLFLELSPHPVLVTSIQQQIEGLGPGHGAWPSLRREEDEIFSLLETLAGLHVAGCTPDWRRLFPGSHAVAALPSYPWKKERYWHEGEDVRTFASGRTDRFGLARIPEIAGEPERRAWQIVLDRRIHDTYWDHRVGGVATLSAASSLRTVLAAASDLFGNGSRFVLEDVRFRGPVVLPDEGDPPEIQVVLERDNGPGSRFGFFERSGGDWTIRVDGTVRVDRSDDDGMSRLDDEEAHREISEAGASTAASGHDEYEALGAAGVRIGPPVRVIESVERCAEGITGRLRVPEGMDPLAAVLEAAFHLSAMAARERRDGGEGELCMPVTVERIVLGTEVSVASRIRSRTRPAEAEETVLDIEVLGARGGGAFDFRGVRLTRLGTNALSSLPIPELVYEVSWQRRSEEPIGVPAASQTHRDGKGMWLVFEDGHGIGRSFGRIVAREGGRPVPVRRGNAWGKEGGGYIVRPECPEDIARLVEETAAADGGSVRGILYLWAVDGEMRIGRERGGAGAVPGASCLPFMHLLREFARAAWKTVPRIWVATTGAVSVDRDDGVRDVGAAALWGLGRVMGTEHPELWGGAVDVDGVPPEAAAEILWRETAGGGAGEQVAWRGGNRHVARLVRAEGRSEERFRWMRADATYLVTGGLGALGFAVCRWMVSRGARRFLLLGRTPLPPRETWSRPQPRSVEDRIRKVKELEGLGASVHVEAVDVGDREALGAVIRRFDAGEWPPVRGVVHAAGVIRDRLVRDLDPESWGEVFHGKVGGAWALQEEFRGKQLDFLVLFSSLGSVLGQEGQGSYAASNSALDAMAARGRPGERSTVSLSWGPWKGLGFAETTGGSHVISRLASQGIGTLTAEQALGALEWALASDARHVVAAPVDWKRLGESLTRGRPIPLVKDLIPTETSVAGGAQAGAGPLSFRERLDGAAAEERCGILERTIRDNLSPVLKLAPEKIDGRKPFGALGLTSLLGLEFRNRLERILGISLPATLVWNFPTVPALARNLAERLGLALGEGLGVPEAPVATDPLASAEALARLESLSEADAIHALRKGSRRQ